MHLQSKGSVLNISNMNTSATIKRAGERLRYRVRGYGVDGWVDDTWHDSVELAAGRCVEMRGRGVDWLRVYHGSRVVVEFRGGELVG